MVESRPVAESADGLVTGQVASFDDPRGYGTVVADDGRGPWFFHCTAIADGTRTIEVGDRVVFTVVPGHIGRWEAMDINRAHDVEPGSGYLPG